MEKINLKESLNFNNEDKNVCLKTIRKKIIRSLYVYEQEKLGVKDYDYKKYISNLILFIYSFNSLFNNELVNIIVNLNILLQNEFEKKEYKAIVFECVNNIDFLLNEGENDG